MSGVVVWSFYARDNLWSVYWPNVSNELERLQSSTSSHQWIHLGTISAELDMYEVNVQALTQRNIFSGMCRPVKRDILSQETALGQGVVWQYEGKSLQWHMYDLETIQEIESIYSNQDSSSHILNLNAKAARRPYAINVKEMTQTRVDTGKVRRIQRVNLPQLYTAETASCSASSIPGSSAAETLSQSSMMPKGSSKRKAVAKAMASTVFEGSLTRSRLKQAKKQKVELPELLSPIKPPKRSRKKPKASTNPRQAGSSTNENMVSNPDSAQAAQAKTTTFLQPAQVPPPTQETTPPDRSMPYTANAYAIPESLPAENEIIIRKEMNKLQESGIASLVQFMENVKENLGLHECTICLEKLSEESSYAEGQEGSRDAVRLKKCDHFFHRLCLAEMCCCAKGGFQCPSCKTTYGIKIGNCPDGTMEWRIIDSPLPGHQGCKTISVSYNIEAGIQGPEHPSPGQYFSVHGFPRIGYIPDGNQGRKILKLLIEAFRRRLMFTIGTSVTSGATNTVTWNEIHHKTNPFNNYNGHGYPDPNYLDNVLLELASHGITEDILS